MVEFPEEMCRIVAKLTEGFSFAYLKELFVIALLTFARGGAEENPAQKTETTTLTKEAEGEKKDGAKQEKKGVVPEVEIPADLKQNVLFNVLRVEIEALLQEMDNTKQEDWLSDRKKTAGGSSGIPMLRIAQAVEN
jgi:hypothetical protein